MVYALLRRRLRGSDVGDHDIRHGDNLRLEDCSRTFVAGPRLTGAHIRAMDDAVRLADTLSAIDGIREDFASLDDWEDRYRYVIELGNTLEPLGKEAHNELTKVRGCVSQVWLECEPKTNAEGEKILHYRGDSDSHLVRGLIAISIALFSDRTPGQILAVDATAAFRELGLEQHLTPQRSNGVRAMVDRIRTDAAGLRLGAA
jgi:cysteine desulfuration protein SufE